MNAGQANAPANRNCSCESDCVPISPEDQSWVSLQDISQVWWQIICTYDGVPGSTAAAVGCTAEEARQTFLDSLAYPGLAVAIAVSPLGLRDTGDVISEILG